jgi:histidinol-phosphate aminotransferase
MSIRPKRALLDPALQRPSALASVPRDPQRLWLDKNENLDPELAAVAQRVLTSVPANALSTYPEAGELYRKLAQWSGVPAESFLLTPGSDGAIRLVFEAFVENGDAVLHTAPTFAMYPVYSQMFGADAHAIDYKRVDDAPWLDTQEILMAVRTRRPKLLCLPNPDSPTGTVLQQEVLREILAQCEASGTVLLIDEAYHPFHTETVVQWTRSSRNLIVARTFAKAWGAAGMRIGYAVAHPETIALLHKMRPMYETGTVAVEFMARMLDHVDAMEQSVARIEAGKAFFRDQMNAIGFKVLPTAGNFTHVAFGTRAAAVHAALAGKVLYRKDFEQPCLAGYSRFSVAPQAIMAQVVNLIKEAAEKNS